MASPSTTSGASQAPIDAPTVGWAFVQNYYTLLNSDPDNLFHFYSEPSTLIYGTEPVGTGDESESDIGHVAHGREEIKAQIASRGLNNCRVLISKVDAVSSVGGSVVLQVLGEMSNADGPAEKFAQTFCLAPQQPAGFFVMNDILRFMRDDIDALVEEPAEVETAPAVDAAPVDADAAAAIEEQSAAAAVAASTAEVEAAAEPVAEPVSVEAAPAEEPTAEAAEPEPTETSAEATPTVAAAEVQAETPLPTEAEETIAKPTDKQHAPAESTTATATETAPKAEAAKESIPEPSAAPAPAPSATPISERIVAAAAVEKPAAKPSSWASLAARNHTAWGTVASESRGVVQVKTKQNAPAAAAAAASTVNATTPATAPAASANSAAANANQSDVRRSTSGTSSVNANANANGGFIPARVGRGGFDRPNTPSNFAKNINTKSIFVKFTEGLTESQVRTYFSSYGNVVAVELYKHKQGGYVDFDSEAPVTKALQNYGKHVINGKQIRADVRRKPVSGYSTPAPSRTGSGSGTETARKN
ncbi:hypothetical protein GQ42DRAFT_163709 [Ramicandelaber brevisporus]|nr:hypothetical protein GQ42DRAFT_163709 [Ramicandelaber brevisporus]